MALFYSVTVLHVQVWTYEIILQFGSKILSVLENTSNLVNKLFDKLKVLRADTLWAVDQKHQVDVCRLAGWRRTRQTKDGRFNYLIYFTVKNMIKEIKTWNTKQTLQHKYHSKKHVTWVSAVGRAAEFTSNFPKVELLSLCGGKVMELNV